MGHPRWLLVPNPLLVSAHIEAQARLRGLVSRAVQGIWTGLPGYDEENVANWLARVVPVVLAGQRQSAALTDAFIARAMRRAPIGIKAETVTGAAARNGVAPQEIYRRPFVTVWTALGNGQALEQAVTAGLARARSTAAMDIQLASRSTLTAIEQADGDIRGWQRVADPGACEFCQQVDGAFVKSAAAMPLHNHCGCTLEPLTSRAGTSPVPDGVAVHMHGELGPVLTSPDHHFTSEAVALG